MGNMTEQRAGFNSMKESTKADWDIISARHLVGVTFTCKMTITSETDPTVQDTVVARMTTF